MINKNKLETAIEILRALNHPLRLKILKFIHNKKRSNVNSIYRTLKLEQSVTSQHLSILRDTNLVIDKREGKNIYYSIDYDMLSKYINAIDTYSLN